MEGLNVFLKHLSIIETLIDKFKERILDVNVGIMHGMAPPLSISFDQIRFVKRKIQTQVRLIRSRL